MGDSSDRRSGPTGQVQFEAGYGTASQGPRQRFLHELAGLPLKDQLARVSPFSQTVQESRSSSVVQHEGDGRLETTEEVSESESEACFVGEDIDADALIVDYVDPLLDLLKDGINSACNRLSEQDPPSLTERVLRTVGTLTLAGLSQGLAATTGGLGTPLGAALVASAASFLTTCLSDWFSGDAEISLEDFRLKRTNALGDSKIAAHETVRRQFRDATPAEWARVVEHWRSGRDLREALQQQYLDDTVDHWLNTRNAEEHGTEGPLGGGGNEVGEAADFQLHLDLTVVIRGAGEFSAFVEGAQLRGLSEGLRTRFMARPLGSLGCVVDIEASVRDLQWDDESTGNLRHVAGATIWTRDAAGLVSRVGPRVLTFARALARIAGIDPYEAGDEDRQNGAELLWERLSARTLASYGLVEEIDG